MRRANKNNGRGKRQARRNIAAPENKTSGDIAALESRMLLSAQPVGSEFLVNSYATRHQLEPGTAMDADGDFVIVWVSSDQDGDGWGIYAQRYAASGTPQGSEFRVNTHTTDNQSGFSVAMDDDGDFVITWSSKNQDGSDYGIYAQRFNAAGLPQGNEFRVNSTTESSQSGSAVAMDSNGDFVITWSQFMATGGSGLYGQRYNAAGTPQGGEFQIAYTPPSSVSGFTISPTEPPIIYYQSNSAIAMDPDGNFVIAWQSEPHDGDRAGIYARRYDSAGIPQGTEFRVNDYTTSMQAMPEIAMDDQGDFVIAWQSIGQDGHGYGIYARRFESAGTPLGTDFRVNTYTGQNQEFPSIAMDADGDFVVAWHHTLTEGGSFSSVYAQRFNESGTPDGTQFRLNSSTTNGRTDAALAMDADGDFVAAWVSVFQDGEDSSIVAQLFRTSHADALGVKRSTGFYLDSNHSATWNGPALDTLNIFGNPGDKPLVGDWNGDGYSDVGVWQNGSFSLDADGNGIWNGPAIDKKFAFGNPGDIPLVGDWNGDGKDDVGVWRNGKFYLDLNGNRAWNSSIDGVFSLGSVTDTPVIGDWNGDGIDDIGVRRANKFYLDLNGNRAWNAALDGIFQFGLATDTPLIGDWNGDGTDDLGVWRTGKFYQDTNANRAWNSGVDQVTSFGALTDTPLIGYWRPKTIQGIPPSAAPIPCVLAASSATGTETLELDSETLASLIASPTKKRSIDQ